MENPMSEESQVPGEVRTTPPASRSVEATLEEIAEDMLDILERLNSIERQVREQGRAIETFRTEAWGQSRALSMRYLFDAVAPAIDTLQVLARGLDPAIGAGGYQQVISAAATLNIVLQTLGFQRFDAAAGDPFDPARMECLGYAEGLPGRVLEMIRQGYAAGEIVVRPAGVLIADPRAAKPAEGTAAAARKGEECSTR
jgi:molecular chaperone GrpE